MASWMEGGGDGCRERDTRDTGGRQKPQPGSLQREPNFPVRPQEEMVDTCDQSKMAACLFLSPLIGFPEAALETATGEGQMATGARRKKFPPAKFQINFDLCIVYIRILKGT